MYSNRPGRPLKFKTAKELREYLKSKSYFKTEKELCDYIELNMDLFCKDVLGGKLKSYKREWYLSDFKIFGSNRPRIDFFIELVGGRRIGIECKNPTSVYSELAKTISQLLSYSIIAEENKAKVDELAIVTSQYDDTIIKIIRKFNLPIKVFILTKEFSAEIR